MEVTIRLAGVFRLGRFKEADREYPPGTTVRRVVEELQIPGQLLGIVLINGVHTDVDSPLHDGDVLSLLPVLGGG